MLINKADITVYEIAGHNGSGQTNSMRDTLHPISLPPRHILEPDDSAQSYNSKALVESEGKGQLIAHALLSRPFTRSL